MKVTWDKLTKAQWDKACATACAAGRTEVPAVLQAQRAAQKKRQAVKNTVRGMEGQ